MLKKTVLILAATLASLAVAVPSAYSQQGRASNPAACSALTQADQGLRTTQDLIVEFAPLATGAPAGLAVGRVRDGLAPLRKAVCPR
jgi:hypothetical protein